MVSLLACITTYGNGSYEHKPRNKFTTNREVLVGSDNSTQVNERRFITGVTIQSNEKAIDIINKITSSIRGILNYSGDKISLSIDKQEETPVMIFNDTNIEQNSISMFGVRENEIVTAVDASYINPQNSFKRDVVSIDSAERFTGRNNLGYDKKETLDLFGVTRKSQAQRACQYYIAASKYSKRRIDFTTGAEAINLALGDLIRVSIDDSGVRYGYNGRISANNGSNITLESYSTNRIPLTAFTSNTNPLSITVARQNTDDLVTYVLSNARPTISVDEDTGRQSVEVTIANNIVPTVDKGDLWSLGETTVISSVSSVTYENWSNRQTVSGSDRPSRDANTLTTDGLYHFAPSSDNVNSYQYEGVIAVWTEGTTQYQMLCAGAYQGTGEQGIRSRSLPSGSFGAWGDIPAAREVSDTNTISDTPLFVKVSTSETTNLPTDQPADGFQEAAGILTSHNGVQRLDIGHFGNQYWTRNYNAIVMTNTRDSKSGKLFKVLELSRDTEREAISVRAEEYISDIYMDSDTFIDVSPAQPRKIQSTMLPPPAPIITTTSTEVKNADGSVGLNIKVDESTNRKYYFEDFGTDFYYSVSSNTQVVSNIVKANTSSYILDTMGNTKSENRSTITGKNGFRAQVGKIPLLCTRIVKETYSNNSLGKLRLTIAGLSVISANSKTRPKVGDTITLPIYDKVSTANFLLNNRAPTANITATILEVTTNSITIENNNTNNITLYDTLSNKPFYVLFSQDIGSSDKTIFIPGFFDSQIFYGDIKEDSDTFTITLDNSPRYKEAITLKVDNAEVSDFTFANSNVSFSPMENDKIYKVIVDYYRPPIIEVGDYLSLDTGETFVVANTSYLTNDSANNALTNNFIYNIVLNEAPQTSLLDQSFVNVSKDLEGVVSENGVFSYNSSVYPGNYTLPNVYRVNKVDSYELINPSDLEIRDVSPGTIYIAARNRNNANKLSPLVTKPVRIDSLEILKISEPEIIETIYEDSTVGVSNRATLSFISFYR